MFRARAGDFVDATDGRGAVARLRIAGVGAEVRAEVLSVERPGRKRETRLWCGAPERGRADWLVEKLAELGVARFQPLECEGAPWSTGDARAGRWRRLTIAALRQSRRTFLMEILPPISVAEAIETLEHPGSRVVGDSQGRHAGGPVLTAGLETGAIGPSGGFQARERQRLDAAGFVPIRLADGRLRTETAAVSLAAWWAMGGS